jgi:UPF0716 family protein affecting phage T7 exclusion
MNRKTQRDLFLLLTVIGTFLTLMLMILSGLFAMQMAREVLAELGRGNRTVLATCARRLFPIWFDGGLILLGTIYSYRRYYRLAFDSK